MSVLPQPLQLAAADGLPSHAIPMTSPECSNLRQQQGLTEPAGTQYSLQGTGNSDTVGGLSSCHMKRAENRTRG